MLQWLDYIVLRPWFVVLLCWTYLPHVCSDKLHYSELGFLQFGLYISAPSGQVTIKSVDIFTVSWWWILMVYHLLLYSSNTTFHLYTKSVQIDIQLISCIYGRYDHKIILRRFQAIFEMFLLNIILLYICYFIPLFSPDLSIAVLNCINLAFIIINVSVIINNYIWSHTSINSSSMYITYFIVCYNNYCSLLQGWLL